jgi:hypothetical protein
VNKYTWVDMGSSYLPSELLAAFLLAQLEARVEIQARRQRIWERYAEGLRDWAGDRGVRLPAVPADREQPFHMFYLILPSRESRQGLIAHLKERSILAVFHYLPLHLSAMGRSFGGVPGSCPVTEDLSDRLLRLPFFNDLTEEEQARVIGAIRDFRADPGVQTDSRRRRQFPGRRAGAPVRAEGRSFPGSHRRIAIRRPPGAAWRAIAGAWIPGFRLRRRRGPEELSLTSSPVGLDPRVNDPQPGAGARGAPRLVAAPGGLPFARSFDLVGLFDVVEHVADDGPPPRRRRP